MIVRNPRLTFEDAVPHWAANRAFAQIINSASVNIPGVEIFLNKVMAKAAGVIEDPAVRADVETFMAQEGHHYRQHRAFNKTLYGRYPRLPELERDLTAFYDTMLAERSLAFNAAYCEGFESLGLIHVEFFFEQVDDLLEHADPRLVRLWRWHLAEEFEHRTVCYDVHYALGSGYLMRLRGLFKAVSHLGGQGKKVSGYLLSVDSEDLSDEQRRVLVQLEKTYRRRLSRFSLPRLLAIMSPFYNPRRKRMPRGVAEMLAQVAPARAPAADPGPAAAVTAA